MIKAQKSLKLGDVKGRNVKYSKDIFRIVIANLAAILFLFSSVTTALGLPTISIDMDPGTTGIQNTLTVAPGDIFTVDVVIADDGSPPTPILFDTIILEVFFNNSGSVLDPGPIGPLGGSLAGNSGSTLGAFDMSPSSTGSPLTAGPASPTLPAGFASGSGAIGLLDPSTFSISSPTTIFSIDFTGLVSGQSAIRVSGTPVGSPGLALAGLQVPMPPALIVLAPAEVTIIAEPMTLKEDAITMLEDIKDDINGGISGVGDPKHAREEIDKAVKDINKSLDSKLWAGPNRLVPEKGQKVFVEEEKAVKDIFDAIEKGKISNSDIIDDLLGIVNKMVDADSRLVVVAISDAQADPDADQEEIAEAEEDLAEGNSLIQAALAETDLDKKEDLISDAIGDSFRDAWKAAIDAIEEAEEEADDDDDDDDDDSD